MREQELEGTVDVDDLMAEKHAIVEARRKVSVPGVIDCVCDIVKYNYGKVPMAIASSGIKKNVLEGLKENGMLRYFDAVITHEDVASGKNKPAPDIFLLAAERLGVESGEGARACCWGASASAFAIPTTSTHHFL